MTVTFLPNPDGLVQGQVEESFQEMISIEPVVQSLSQKTSPDLGDEQGHHFQALFFVGGCQREVVSKAAVSQASEKLSVRWEEQRVYLQMHTTCQKV